MRFTPAQLSNTRHMAEEHERKALTAARSMHRIRKEMRTTMAKVYDYQWGVEFYADTMPRMAQNMALSIPRMQLALERDVSYIRRYEDDMATHVAAALAGKRLLDRHTRRATPRREQGLWVLLQVCLRGWLAGRGKRC